MRIVQMRIASFFFAFLCTTLVQSQTLSPDELNEINNIDFSTATRNLSNKGYQLQRNEGEDTTKTKAAKWCFQVTQQSEQMSAFLIKSVDSNRKSKTTFYLFNPFNYREFINDLLESKYRYQGIQIIDDKTYSAFNRKTSNFLVTPLEGEDRVAYFQIILTTE